MKAAEVKEALRGRHPAVAQYGGPGPWTTVEEWRNIDLLAFSSWSSAKPPIVGYEVKVARGDYRRELLKPSKRTLAVASCWQFYFAVPKGLLTKEEKAYREPEHFEDGGAFVRDTCPARCSKISGRELKWLLGPHSRQGMQQVTAESARQTGAWRKVDTAYGEVACTLTGGGWGESKLEPRDEFAPAARRHEAGGPVQEWEPCATCGGRGYMRKSVVEEQAPTLWIPNDVGLIEVSDSGRCHTVRKAPTSEPTEDIGPLNQLLRWVSYRPDPRHVAEAERQANGGLLDERLT